MLWAGYLTVAVAEARGQFGNQKEEERLPLEVVTRGLMKADHTEKDLSVGSSELWTM